MTEQPKDGEDTMITAPVNPGPLVMSDSGQPVVVALNLVAETASPPDHGIIAEVFNFANRPDWEGHAAWLVRASNNHEALVEALTEATKYLIAERDSFYDSMTDPDGSISDPDDQDALSDIDEPIERYQAVLAQATGAPEAGDPK